MIATKKEKEALREEGREEEEQIAGEAETPDEAEAAEGGEAADGEDDADDNSEPAEEGEQPEAEDAAGIENAKYLRLAADFQNYKKRMEKERFERYSEGKKDFAADLLPVLDNFDRALKQDVEQAEGESERAFIEGMAMILKQFQDALEKNGVYEIEALGTDFNPNVHHAVAMEPSDRFESQKVSEVLMKGYRMGEKVIRPSMVKVAE